MMRFAPKNLALCGIALAIATTAYARDDIVDIAMQAEKINENAGAYLKDLNLETELSDKAIKLAEEIVSGSIQAAERSLPEVAQQLGVELQKQQGVTTLQGDWIDILVSRSLGEELTQTIHELADSKIQVRFVFRGIAEGQRINDAFADYGRWTQGLESPPAAILDPGVFRESGATAVPHMIYMRDGAAIASVRGLSNPQWLADAVERGELGDLGTLGPVVEIAERDLIEVMKERAANLDLESRRDETIATYWQRAGFTTLSPAKKDRRRTIDPSVVVNQDIKDAQGKVLVSAGTHINPLAMRPFTLRLIVFNPTRHEEVEWVSRLTPSPGLEDMLIATEIDRDEGWKHFESVQERLDAPVYMLKPDIAQRFALERTPSLVTAENLHFVVHEIVAKEQEPNDAN